MISVAIGLPAPASGTYSYIVPPETPVPLRGARVLVPFGRQSRVGFALGEGDGAREGLRAILEVLDETPLVTPELMRFLEEASAYYLASLPDFLKLAVSSAPWPDARARVRVTDAGRAACASAGLLPLAHGGRGEMGILRALPACRAMTIATLRQKAGGAGFVGSLARLVARGLATVEDPPDRKRRGDDPATPLLPPVPRAAAPPRELLPDQKRALAMLSERLGSAGTVLLHGVTASGKTEVYVRLMKDAMARGGGVLYLAPEIALSEALHGVVERGMEAEVAILHSGLGESARRRVLDRLLAGEVRAVLGPRSALFAPVKDLALVIVDEEHEASYKSQLHPRYHARDMAVLRGHLAGALVVLGSATPSVESYHCAERGKYGLVAMPSRVHGAPLPEVIVADMRRELKTTGHPGLFCRPLTEALDRALRDGEQGLILLNRRGYASVLLCRGCGDAVPCPRCSQNLVYHKAVRRLICHLCGRAQILPTRCPSCGGDLLEMRGAGTERMLAEADALWPDARPRRVDSDLTPRQASQAFASFASGSCRLLVGTQMIAKGHDFANVGVVGVLSADALLSFPDFRGAERTFQLLTQVAGRAGRKSGTGTVILQCWNPSHYAIATARDQDYESFYRQEIHGRSAQLLPPKVGLAVVHASAPEEESAALLAKRAAQSLREASSRVEVLGPAPAFRSQVAGRFRQQIVVRARQRKSVRDALAACAAQSRTGAPFGVRGSSLLLDVDPVDLL